MQRESRNPREMLLEKIKALHKLLIRSMFDSVDVDGSGNLDIEEVATLAVSLGNKLDENQLKAAMEIMDQDGSGEVDFSEFFHWWCTRLDDPEGGLIKVTLKDGGGKDYEIVPF